MRNRPWRPHTLVWVVALLLAAALGFVIGGNPAVAKDVPLKDRKLVVVTLFRTSAPVADHHDQSRRPRPPPVADSTGSSGGNGRSGPTSDRWPDG